MGISFFRVLEGWTPWEHKRRSAYPYAGARGVLLRQRRWGCQGVACHIHRLAPSLAGRLAARIAAVVVVVLDEVLEIVQP